MDIQDLQFRYVGLNWQSFASDVPTKSEMYFSDKFFFLKRAAKSIFVPHPEAIGIDGMNQSEAILQSSSEYEWKNGLVFSLHQMKSLGKFPIYLGRN